MTEPSSPRPEQARTIPAWGSLWRVVENQAHNALNDKVAQFILLDRVLFGRDAHRERTHLRLEVAEAPPTGAILALRRARSRPEHLDPAEYRKSGSGSV